MQSLKDIALSTSCSTEYLRKRSFTTISPVESSIPMIKDMSIGQL